MFQQLEGIDETIRRITSVPGIFAVIVTNQEGIPLKTTIDQTSTVHYVSRVTALYKRCVIALREIDPGNELELLRVRSKRHEILAMMTKEYMLLIIQNPVVNAAG